MAAKKKSGAKKSKVTAVEKPAAKKVVKSATAASPERTRPVLRLVPPIAQMVRPDVPKRKVVALEALVGDFVRVLAAEMAADKRSIAKEVKLRAVVDRLNNDES